MKELYITSVVWSFFMVGKGRLEDVGFYANRLFLELSEIIDK